MLIQGDALTELKKMDGNSINCIVTSPPYWSLRKYDIPDLVWDDPGDCGHEWKQGGGGLLHENRNFRTGTQEEVNGPLVAVREERKGHDQFCLKCSAWRGQLGLEPTIDLYLSHLIQIMDECFRVLRNDGTMWVNISDSYSGSGKGLYGDGLSHGTEGIKQKTNHGSVGIPGTPFYNVPPKSLCLIPERFVIKMVEKGWVCRSDIIWAKPNPMPESVTDRPTRSHEYIFMFVKSRKYYFDQEAVKEISKYPDDDRKSRSIKMPDGWDTGPEAHGSFHRQGREKGQKRYPTNMISGIREGSATYSRRNIRSVWTIATQPFSEAHYAVFPQVLVERCIKAGCPVSGIVLDPFCGSGTTLKVAEKLGREAIGIDLGYQDLQEKRIKWNQKELLCH